MKKEEGRKQVGATIEENLWRHVKAIANLQGRKTGEVLDDCIREYLQRHSEVFGRYKEDKTD